MATQLLYALISRGKTVLAEFTDQAGNFPTVTRMLLGKVDDSKNGRVSYVYDQYMFHYLVNDGLIFLCLTDVNKSDSERVRMPYLFLNEIQTKFINMYGDKATTAIAFEMNNEFGKYLETTMARFNSGDTSGDNISAVRGKLDAVKDVMVQNIESVLERGEKLELLVDKTDQLQTQAFQFQSTSRKLKNAMLMRKLKMYAAITFIVLVIIWVISAIACGIDYSKCGNDKKK